MLFIVVADDIFCVTCHVLPVRRVIQVVQVCLELEVTLALAVHQAIQDQRVNQLLESTESVVRK